LVYQSPAGRVAMVSVAVEPEYRHHGASGEPTAGALEDVADCGGKATIICPVVRSFVDEHPEYAGAVDPERPGIRTTADA
jgi:hypothetical protein